MGTRRIPGISVTYCEHSEAVALGIKYINITRAALDNGP